jgi:RNA polymerase sigma-70 factor (ECF subfamily)
MAGRQVLMGNDSDRALVRRFVRHRDGEAFSVLVNRYADMVYTTSWRVLRDETLASDAVQETFFHLVKNADRITGSLASWLHRVATRRAVDLIRQNVSRRSREESYALEATAPENSWAEVEPAVDEALEQLPEESRDVLLLHYLQGQSTVQIAAAHGVSQPTISRRLAGALELLREKLREKGISAGIVPLQAVLLHSNVATPEALRITLGKIALAKAAGAHSLFILAKSTPVKLALASSAILLATSTFWLNRPAQKHIEPLKHRSNEAPNLAETTRAKKDAAFLQPPAPPATGLSKPQATLNPPQNAQTISQPPPPRPPPAPKKSLPPSEPPSEPNVPIAGANIPGPSQIANAEIWPNQNWAPTVPVFDNRPLGELNLGGYYRPPVNALENDRTKTNYNNNPIIARTPQLPAKTGAFSPARSPGQTATPGPRRAARSRE